MSDTTPSIRTALYGNPPQESYTPRKADMVAVLTQLQTMATLGGRAVFRDTRSGLNAVTGDAGDIGFVLDDGSDSGIHEWDEGGSEWVKVANLPEGWDAAEVISVAGRTGVVVLDADDIDETSERLFLHPDERAALAELDNKAPLIHSHTMGDVSGLQSALDGKAPLEHDHTIAQVGGLTAELDGLRRRLAAPHDRPGRAAEAWVTQTTGTPGALPGIDQDGAVSAQSVPGLGHCAVIDGADRLVAPREALSVHPGRVYVAFFAAARLANGADPLGDSLRFAMTGLDAGYQQVGEVVFQDQAATVAQGTIRGAFKFSVGSPGLANVDADLPMGTVQVRPYVRSYGADTIDAVAQVQILDVTEVAAIDGALDVATIQQAITDAQEAAGSAAAAAEAAALESGKVTDLQTASAADFHLDNFAAIGDGVTDNRTAILNAMAAAAARGGGRVRGTSGLDYAFTGRIEIPQFVHLDLGREPQGARLIALSDQGGIDMLAGCQLTGWLRAAGANDEIGLLGMRRETMVERPREGEVQIRYDVFLDRVSGHSTDSIGLHIDNPDLSSDPELGGWTGFNWTRGHVTIRNFDYAVKIYADGNAGWNSNTLKGDIRDFVYGFWFDSERSCALNRVEFQFQTGGGNRARRAFWARQGLTRNSIGLYVWDWNPQSIHPTDNAMIVFEPGCDENDIYGFAGNPPDGFGAIVDRTSTTRPNRWHNFLERNNPTYQEALLPLARQFSGDETNHLAYARRKFSVSSEGTAPFPAGGLESIFEPPGIGVVDPMVDASITIDTGVSAEWLVIGIDFNTDNPGCDRCIIEVSPDNSNWTTVVQYGGNGAGVPGRVGSVRPVPISDSRYTRFSFSSDDPRRLSVARIFGQSNNIDIIGKDAAWIPANEGRVIRSLDIIARQTGENPNDGLRINGHHVLGRRFLDLGSGHTQTDDLLEYEDGDEKATHDAGGFRAEDGADSAEMVPGALSINGDQVVGPRQALMIPPGGDGWAIYYAYSELLGALGIAGHGLTAPPTAGPNLIGTRNLVDAGTGTISFDKGSGIYTIVSGGTSADRPRIEFDVEAGEEYLIRIDREDESNAVDVYRVSSPFNSENRLARITSANSGDVVAITPTENKIYVSTGSIENESVFSVILLAKAPE